MSSGVQSYDPNFGWEPAIPEPFWTRSWRTAFRWRPQCIEHGMTFRTKLDYQSHWRREHGQEGPNE